MQLHLDDFASNIDHLRAVIVTVTPDNLLYDAWTRNGDLVATEETAVFFGALVQSHIDALAPSGIDASDVLITIEADGRVVVLKNIGEHYVVGFIFNDAIAMGVLRLQLRRLVAFLTELLPVFELPSYGDEEPSPLANAPAATDVEESEDEEPVYYGYVYARDFERQQAALREHLPTAEHPVAPGPGEPPPSMVMPMDGLRLDVDADDMFGADSDDAQLHDPEHSTAMQQSTTPPTDDAFRPDTTTPLTVPFQERAMENEGGPVPDAPVDTAAPAPLTADMQANAMDNEGGAQQPPPVDADCRAARVIRYVKDATGGSPNVLVRLAVHAEITLAELRKPEQLSAEQAERLERVARQILQAEDLALPDDI